MAGKLPIDERMIAAARMATRGSIHFDLWWLTASKEGREQHWEALEEHWEHLRFLQHGQLVAAVGEVHALLDRDKRTINLPDLVDEVERTGLSLPLARAKLAEARPAFLKLKKLRNNVFAHRTVRMSYNDVFTAAEMTPDQLRDLVQVTLTVANELLPAFGCEPIAATPLPKEHYAKMLKLLSSAPA